jgi:hypothetical protein
MQYQLPLEIWNEIYNYLSLKDKFSLLQSNKLLFNTFGINYMKEILYTDKYPKIVSINTTCLNNLIEKYYDKGYLPYTSVYKIEKCIVCKLYTKDISDIPYENRNNERYHYRTIEIDNYRIETVDGQIYCEKCVDIDRICQQCHSYLTLDPDFEICDLCIHNCQNEDEDEDDDEDDEDEHGKETDEVDNDT